MYRIKEGCPGCGACLNICPVNAIIPGGSLAVSIAGDCIDCGLCAGLCPVGLIEKSDGGCPANTGEQTPVEGGLTEDA
jgi:NAD-dependent dihydropyrimidine dehydrogenase PreA subunit